jgi:hypothetical protein
VFPAYAWRLRIEPTQTPELNAITIEILNLPARKMTEEFDFERAKVLQTIYTFRATPRTVDLQKDFGLDDDGAAKLSASVPGGNFNPNDVDPHIFATMSVPELMQILPGLLEAFGISLDQVKGQLPEELRTALEQLQQNPESQPSDGGGSSAGGATTGGSRGGTKPGTTGGTGGNKGGTGTGGSTRGTPAGSKPGKGTRGGG